MNNPSYAEASKGKENLKIAFWGTGPLAESAIYNLYKNGYTIQLIVTKPDSKIGRHQEISEPYIKKWGESKGIKVIQPERLKMKVGDNIDGYNLMKGLISDCDISIVASYGKIIPAEILALPKYGFINIHPSDLPLLRGPSPIESQLLTGAEEITISIMELNEKMDAGNIIVKNKIKLSLTDTASEVEIMCGQAGGQLLSDVLMDYINGNFKSVKQRDEDATFCKFIQKEDGEINLDLSNIEETKIKEIKNKYRAYNPWPGIYFYLSRSSQSEGGSQAASINSENKNIRVKINKIDLSDPSESDINKIILRVTPEGKKEISWEDFKKGYVDNYKN